MKDVEDLITESRRMQAELLSTVSKLDVFIEQLNEKIDALRNAASEDQDNDE